jgi:hypothetical protein
MHLKGEYQVDYPETVLVNAEKSQVNFCYLSNLKLSNKQ